MVQMYTIAGRQVGSHFLAMATLSLLGVGSYVGMGGSAAKKTQQGPPINAGSPDEESFIKDFLKNAEADEKKGGNEKAAH
ncbi:uncharacterized protein LY89DRAFT_647256 [Mollisia scopiformis]|uniref:ATP synthase subunit K, mitochondrial n=1 Tax=Mollisia scopiformis TaxID=149040 RepID=A0A194X8Z3_MOLSC|nr:uncharacterized protein LY89DRAFT_647256 [Mollisia scopiformis]KUJ16584.1 hypothetical protein LY89DRAFT_647256 [Mollisia scopiformis]